jgi:outer membrane cobalamin receptor
VDIETFGVELIASKRWDTIESIASYTHLSKDEDYGNGSIDASFYALNYAKHRFTLGAIWSPSDTILVRIDNEWRQNQENSLRLGSDSALFTHLGLSIYPPQLKNMELFFAIDNAWDDNFQDVPGTPGRGDQYSAGLIYSW